MIKYYNGTNKKCLTLSADYFKVIKWCVDAIFAVHPYFKSHNIYIVTMEQGAMQSVYRKHKMNTRSSTEAELVDVVDA